MRTQAPRQQEGRSTLPQRLPFQSLVLALGEAGLDTGSRTREASSSAMSSTGAPPHLLPRGRGLRKSCQGRQTTHTGWTPGPLEADPETRLRERAVCLGVTTAPAVGGRRDPRGKPAPPGAHRAGDHMGQWARPLRALGAGQHPPDRPPRAGREQRLPAGGAHAGGCTCRHSFPLTALPCVLCRVLFNEKSNGI